MASRSTAPGAALLELAGSRLFCSRCSMATYFGSSFDVVEHALAVAEQLQTHPAVQEVTHICLPYTLYTMLLEHVQ